MEDSEHNFWLLLIATKNGSFQINVQFKRLHCFVLFCLESQINRELSPKLGCWLIIFLFWCKALKKYDLAIRLFFKSYLSHLGRN